MTTPAPFTVPTQRPTPTDRAPRRGDPISDLTASPGAGVAVRWTQNQPVVMLVGDMDLVAAPQIASAGQFLRHWSYPATVDAAQVAFMDVAGLRAVLGLAGASGQVQVRYPSAAVLRLLRVLRQAGAGVQVSRAPGPHAALMLQEPPRPH